MNFVSTKAINKRGKAYNCRPTRNANGFSKHYAAGNVPDKFLKMAVHGTFDVLARLRIGEIIKVRLRHPTDFGYSKTSYILKKNRHKFLDRII